MIAVIFHRLGPYHHARLAAAAGSLSICAIQGCSRDKTYAWDKVVHGSQFPCQTLFGEGDVEDQPAHRIRRQLSRALDPLGPQVLVIPGWSSRLALTALEWSLRWRKPAVIMSESNAWDERRVCWRERIKRRLVRLCSSGLAGGASQQEYLEKLGMPSGRVFRGYDAVDNSYFAKGAEEVRGRWTMDEGRGAEGVGRNAEILKAETLKAGNGKQGAESRNKYGLPERYFLASARFIERKNLARLLQAYARYRSLCDDHRLQTTGQRDSARQAEARGQKSVVSGPVVPWSLILLGDGPLRPDLCRLISDLSLHDSVALPGFKQYPDLPTYYGLASAFIHASTTEQWGLVVNEAMASGLPVLVSNRCGCARDLVQEGMNGFTFDPLDVNGLAELMLNMSAFQPFRLSAFGDASRRIITDWGPQRFALGLQQAVETALHDPRSSASLADRLLLRLLALR